MSDVKPFTPDEARNHKKHIIPDEVIQVVNELLVRELNDNYATLYEEEIVAEVLKRMPHLTREDAFKNKYFNFEPLFREQGWDVKYDSPGYNESYRAHYVFTAKRGQR